MATITNTIKWVDNVGELKASIASGTDSIVAMKSQVDRTVQSMGGAGLFGAANRLTAAIQDLGGITKLTAAEQERANATLDKAIEKYQAMGQTAPQAMIALRDELAGARQESDTFGLSLKEALENPLGAIKAMGSAVGETALEVSGLGAVAIGIVGGLGAAAVAMGEIAAHARETAAAIFEVSEVTGESVPAVSNLKFAVEAAGGSLEQINNSMFVLENRMENNGTKVNAGLHMIGLSLAEISAMPADQRLLAISEALRNAGDDTNKAAVAMDLFGKQGRDLLPLLLKPLSDLDDQAKQLGVTMTESDAKAAQAFQIQLKTLEAQSTATWTALGLHVSFADLFTLAYDRMKLAVANLAYSFASAVTAIVTLNQYLPAAIAVITGGVGDLPKVSGDAKKGVDALAESTKQLQFKPVALEGAELTRVEQELTKSAEGLIKQHEKEAEALKKYDDNMTAVTQTAQGFGVIVDSIDGSVVEATKYYVEHGVSIQKVGEMYGLTAVQIKALEEEFKFEQQVAADTAKTIDKYTASHQLALPTVMGLSDDARLLSAGLDDEARSAHLAEVQQNQLNDTLKRQATTRNTLADAIAKQNVGLPGGSSGSQFTSTTSSWLDSFAGSAKDFFEAGKLTDIVVKGLTGGGGLMGALVATGSKLGAMFTKSIGDSIGGALGDIIGPLGALAAPLIDKVVSFFKNLGGPSKEEVAGRQTEGQFEQSFGGFNQMMEAVGKAYAATGHSAEEAQHDVKALLDAEKQGPAAVQQWLDKITQITNAYKLQDTAVDAVNQAAQRYGFTLDELGPAMQKQNLDKQAQQLYSDFKVLTAAGIDTNTVLTRMGGSINTFVADALRTGTEIPNAMKPMLDKMVEMGTLTDQNGKVITNLDDAGVKFSMTMSEGFQKVVESVQQLTDAITQKLGLAIQNIPQPKIKGEVTWDTGVIPKPSGPLQPDIAPAQDVAPADMGASTGGRVTDYGIQHFAGGGRVLPFPFLRPPNSQDTVPIWARKDEVVLTPEQQTNAARNAARGGSDTHITIHAVDAQSFESMLRSGHADVMLEVLADRIAKNKKGGGDKMRTAMSA